MARLQKLEGWALMWSDVADRGDFKLKIDPHAFDESIKAGDVQGLMHHDWGRPISRQKNGSMTLENRNEKPTVVVKSGFLKESSIVTNPAMKSSSIRVAPVAPSPQLAELRETLRYSK